MTKIDSSFRDPSGHVFVKNNTVYRSVDPSYQKNYDSLMSSGLYQDLVERDLLVAHQEVAEPKQTGAYKVLKPEQIDFISYPYEWCFSQLKDAALLTLKIQFAALEHGMNLKDASAYNVQFHQGKPIFIDTLSFEKYSEGQPWVAYRQFCQHFLAPLALMAKADLRLGRLSAEHLDGIPLDLAARLLPKSTRFSVGLGAHLHLHARSQQRHADDQRIAFRRLPKQNLIGLLKNLEATVKSLQLPKQKTVWGDYYADTNYRQVSAVHKKEIIQQWLSKLAPKSVWDAGANNGTFSRLASEQRIRTIATDIDPLAIEHAYRKPDPFLLPLVIDLTNPSPAIGWQNTERPAFLQRLKVDLTMALALIHHLAIANNLPLEKVAHFFVQATEHLIIEFVPKTDSNTQRILTTRENIFPDYTEKGFEEAFMKHFVIRERIQVKESVRTLYLMQKR